jgi:hypothetical protein
LPGTSIYYCSSRYHTKQAMNKRKNVSTAFCQQDLFLYMQENWKWWHMPRATVRYTSCKAFWNTPNQLCEWIMDQSLVKRTSISTKGKNKVGAGRALSYNQMVDQQIYQWMWRHSLSLQHQTSIQQKIPAQLETQLTKFFEWY